MYFLRCVTFDGKYKCNSVSIDEHNVVYFLPPIKMSSDEVVGLFNSNE